MIFIAPLVSVIIPCYNRAHLIAQAISSVRRQTFQDWELIIVDDGSSDDLCLALRECCADERIRLVRHPKNLGEPAARNTGIGVALGRFIAFLDSDDEWLPKKLERQVAVVLGMPEPERVICVTQTVVMLTDNKSIIRPLQRPAPGRSFAEFLYNDGGFAQSSSFFLAKSLAERFPFRESLTQMVDHLFFIELGAAGAEYALIPEPLTIWHNEVRADRVSFADNLAKWRATVKHFSEQASSLVPQHVLIACEARFLSGLLWRTAPLESLKLLLRARIAGALSTKQVLRLLCRNVLPLRTYDSARYLLDRVCRYSPRMYGRFSQSGFEPGRTQQW